MVLPEKNRKSIYDFQHRWISIDKYLKSREERELKIKLNIKNQLHSVRKKTPYFFQQSY